MRMILCLTAAALTLAGSARGDEKAEARAILDKAIKAMGGLDKLAAENAMTVKSKGKWFGMGEGIEYTSEISVQLPDRMRFSLEFENNGMKFTMRSVFDGKKGWVKFNDDTTEMDKDAVAEAREEMYAGRVERLVTLVKEKGFELSPVGEVKVGDREAVGIRIASKGHREINLFFDKKTGLLVKSERTIKDQMMGGKERMEEKIFSEFKSIGGVQHAMKLLIQRDGKKYVEAEISEVETKDKIDDAEFAKP